MTGDGSWPAVAAALLGGYLCGSIPFGLLLTRLAGLGDIRSVGSGNIGATNVLRTGRKDIAAATLLCDALKATLPILLAAHWLGPQAGLAAALGAFVGHCFPVWLGFRGGKGVATFIGCLLAIDWRLLVGFAAAWLAVAGLARISSLAGLTAPLVACGLAAWLDGGPTAAVLLLLTAISWAKHRANISRLLAGTEPRIGQAR